jgi:CheY-like chemotaxis protein
MHYTEGRVLLVDDSLPNLQLLETSLKEEYPRAEIVSVQSADKAVRKVKEENFNVAVIDYFLDGVTGTELANRLREAGYSNPIMMVTASDRVAKRLKRKKEYEVIRKGYNGYLQDINKKVDYYLMITNMIQLTDEILTKMNGFSYGSSSRRRQESTVVLT